MSVAWKPWYREERESAEGRARLRAAVARHAGGDPDVTAALRAGGFASFPHTTLTDSADPIARVAGSIVAGRWTRVLAAGVLHGGTLPEDRRDEMRAIAAGGPAAEAAFRALGGGWIDADPGAPRPAEGRWVREDRSLLAGEFSLDHFRAALAVAADAAGRAAPPVTAVFVGPTRGPDASFAAAHAVADALRPLLGPETALVATGDLVHFGHGYSTAPEIRAAPSDPAALESTFRDRVSEMLERAFLRGDVAGAFDASAGVLRSDQRNLLPVLAALVGPAARPRLLDFRLTGYGPILGEPAPCVVASALATVVPSAPSPQGSAPS